MEQQHINYSIKNIPAPSRFQYKKYLVAKVASFITRLRWKMFFILNPSTKGRKQTFGFKSTFNPPQMAELKQFEDELFALVSNILYRPYKNKLQDQMRADKTEILSSDSVIVQADKSPNMYKMSVDEYNKKLKDNITRDYRKASRSDVDEVTKEAAAIARTCDLDDRIDIPQYHKRAAQ